MNDSIDNIVGTTSGRLRVISLEPKVKGITPIANCICECGERHQVKAYSIRYGETKSCGCLGRDITSARSTTHGMSKHPLYTRWSSIRRRCLNKESQDYQWYGGRGIEMHEGWQKDPCDFISYIESLDRGPGQDTIDRINNDGNYEPGNLRWADLYEQQSNTSQCVMLEMDGITLNKKQWSMRTGIHVTTISSRLDMGWSIEDALTRKVRRR